MDIFDIILLAFTIYYCSSVLYLFTGLFRIPCSGGSKKQHFITVILAAHNEEKHLAECLLRIACQDYPKDKYEVIVADDRSTDKTSDIIKKFCEEYNNFKSVRVDDSENSIPKKAALIKGLDIAEGEIVVSTDADCIQPGAWLSSLNACFTDDNGLVIGHTVYHKPDNVWKGIDALDYFSHRALGAAFIGAGSAYTCTASNFAYRKEIFDANRDEFIAIGVRPAEDNYFVHCVHKKTKYKIAVATNPESFVTTNGASGFRDFMNQRFRWSAYGGTITTSGVKLFFIPALFYYFFIWIALINTLFNPGLLTTIVISVFCKFVIDFLFMLKAAMVFKSRYLLNYFLPLSFIHLLLVPVVVLKGNLFSFTWKGRRYTRK